MHTGKNVALCVAIGAFVLVAAAISFPAALWNAVEATLSAPFATGIDDMLLNGEIWLEWDDARKYELVIGGYPTDVLVKHDTEYYYVAMVIHTSRVFAGGLEAFIFFDDGDGVSYSAGDDMLVVAADGGALVEADYCYRATYDFCADTEAGGTNDAHGAGKYDGQAGCYVFEFRRKIDSGDDKDVQLPVGEEFPVTYGWSGS
jgi:hypothetical protein